MKRIMLVAAIVLFTSACMPGIPYKVIESSQILTTPLAADQATVVFVRNDWYLGRLPFALYEGDRIIGVVAGGECTAITVSPGKHLLSSFIKKGALMDGRNRYGFMDVDLAPGKIYYVKVRPFVIPFAGAFSELEPIRAVNDSKEYWKDLPEWLSNCKMTTMADESVKLGNEMYADNTWEREKDYADWTKDEERLMKNMKQEDGVTTPVTPKKN